MEGEYLAYERCDTISQQGYKLTMKQHHTPIKTANTKLTIPSAGEARKPLELSHTAGESTKWDNYSGK